jgi:protein-tyrosine phosphatase/arsenate reductase
MDLSPGLKKHIDRAISGFDQIPEERKESLKKLAGYVKERVENTGQANLTFICTHNSRRSHMSQIWAQVAAYYYGVPGVTTYSGGTEATAFNPRAVAALERAGFEINIKKEGKNPIYLVKSDHDSESMEAFSKVFNDAPNPTKDFCAVMTCSQADAACPRVPGAALRVSIPYDDPKVFDGTDQEAQKYDERSRHIAREMFYVFSQVQPSRDSIS